MKTPTLLRAVALLVLLAFAGSAVPATAQISKTDRALGFTPSGTNSVAFDSANNIYLVVSGPNGGSPGMGQFVSRDGALIGSQFLITDDYGIAGAWTGWYSVAAGGTPTDPVFLVTYLWATSMTNIVQRGRLVRYQVGLAPLVSSPITVVNTNGRWFGAETGRHAWDGDRFVVVTYVGIPGSVNPQPMLHHLDRSGVVSDETIVGDYLDFYGIPSVACSVADKMCLLTGFAAGIPFGPTSAGGSYFRLVNATTLQPTTGMDYLETDHAYRSEDQSVVFNPSTGQFLTTWLSFRTTGGGKFWVDNRLVAVNGTKGSAPPVDGSRSFGPGAGESRTAYNPATRTTLLVSKWSPPSNPGSDVYAVELGDSGAPVRPNNIVFLRPWDGKTPIYNAGIAADAAASRWFVDMWFGNGLSWLVQGTSGTGPAPTLSKSSPASGTGGLSIPVTLTWVAVTGANDYQVCVSTTNGTCSATWTSVGTNLSASVENLSAGAAYYWQVQATVNGSTLSGDSSSWWSFATQAAPPLPPTGSFSFSAQSAPNGSWVFAEGALGLGPGFSTYYEIANENAAATTVRAWFIREGTGAVTSYETTAPARARLTLDLSAIVGGAAGSYSAVFQSATAGQQIYVGRTMYWGDAGGVLTGAGHMKTGAFIPPGESPSTNWYFAEGTRVITPAGTPFQTYFMVFNPNQTAANVTVDFLSDDGSFPMTSVSQAVAGQGRWTLSTDGIAQLALRNFSVRITSNVGIVAERSMYWGANWSAGHTGFGAPTASPDWYFAEGTAQTAFDTYFLLLNPTSSDIDVAVTYQLSPLPNGVPQTPVHKGYRVGANSRKTVYLTGEVGIQPGVSAEFHATGPIVVERSMYWGTSWTEGSTVAGTTTPATEWHLPEGSTEGGFETYLLLSNPNTTDATVTITTFSEDGEQETYPVTVFAKTRLTVYMNNTEARDNAPVWATIQGKPFSVRVRPAGRPLPIVAEEAVYWKQLGNGQYWRGGDATLGFPVIR